MPLALALAYALVRYIVVKGVPIEHAPLYVADKAVAAVALYAFARAISHSEAEARRDAARRGFALAALHALASLPLLSPAYFPAWFVADGRYTLRAEIALALGVASLVLAWHLSKARAPTTAIPGDVTKAQLTVVFLAWAHCTAVGWPNWFDPAAWPGHLPPITLLCALGTAPMLVLALRRAQRSDPR